MQIRLYHHQWTEYGHHSWVGIRSPIQGVLSLSWGVTPVLGEPVPTTDILFHSAYNTAKNLFNLTSGDQIVITGGQINGKSGNTNLLKVDVIQ